MLALLCTPYSVLILLCAYPAVHLLCYALTLLCRYPAFHLPCCAIFSLTLLRHYPPFHLSICAIFSPCCVIILLYAYPAVPFIILRIYFTPLFSAHLFRCAIYLFFCELFSVHLFCCKQFSLAKDIEEEDVTGHTPFQPLEVGQDFP